MTALKNISVRLPEGLREELRKIADACGDPYKEAVLIRSAIDLFIKEYQQKGPAAVGLPVQESTKKKTSKVVTARGLDGGQSAINSASLKAREA